MICRERKYQELGYVRAVLICDLFTLVLYLLLLQSRDLSELCSVGSTPLSETPKQSIKIHHSHSHASKQQKENVDSPTGN